MTSVDEIKRKIQVLYETHSIIHINVNIKKPRVCIVNEPVIITGVYQHIFRIEERTGGAPKCHTLQYSDILTNKIAIVELSES